MVLGVGQEVISTYIESAGEGIKGVTRIDNFNDFYKLGISDSKTAAKMYVV